MWREHARGIEAAAEAEEEREECVEEEEKKKKNHIEIEREVETTSFLSPSFPSFFVFPIKGKKTIYVTYVMPKLDK